MRDCDRSTYQPNGLQQRVVAHSLNEIVLRLNWLQVPPSGVVGTYHTDLIALDIVVIPLPARL